ncbi:hypothetical protein M413DRAFT_447663 [Hebeloma cylindrosporum]|uniref:AB hydrolase-1 domain-containing protein n=1 Tax=Hebeloma cylindrosporum TaxID=76867 RepID=A0A0C3BQ03_HEBCY|nr:hypothetical protein M413DRAFT_447663 [Hebeloma cylindrosporum h7]
MYVEHLVPERVTARLPIVIIPGNGMTGTNFLNTPDGRPGWADYFMKKGYESLYHADNRTTIPATQRFNLWPQAGLHTQWPGNGSRGDETFDNFYASILPFLSSNEEASKKIRSAGVALLDKIGPAIVLTHSQSGQYGWNLGDARPSLVKAIVAIEPTGPPFINAVFPPLTPARPYGLTEIPITFSPPIQSPTYLQTMIVSSDSNFTCIQQVLPARQLVKLANIPVLVVTSQSGYHSIYDACSVEFLKSAGVPVKHVKLPDVGIFGNGHMMFMEKNSLEIVDRVVQTWLREMLGNLTMNHNI